MRIQAKLLLFAFLCSVLPLVATFVLSFNAVNDSLTLTIEENLLSQAEEQLESLQNDLANQKHMLGTLSQLSALQDVNSGDFNGYLQRDLDTFVERTPSFYELVAVDYDGTVVAGTLSQFLGRNLSGSWEFEAPKLGVNYDGPVVESYRLRKHVATQSVPIYHSETPDKILGVLTGSINWEYLQQQLSLHTVFGQSQNQQRQVYLESVDTESILYGTQGLSAPMELLIQPSSDRGMKRVNLDGREFVLVSINSRAIKGIRDPGWRLHVLLDAEIALASVNELKRYFVTAGGLTLVLVLCLGMLFARSIVTPVRSLVTGAERLAAGDYDYALPKNNASDEISQLTDSFNSMRVAVSRNEQELMTKTEVAEQAARLKGEFLANMSHEVRTPINGVLGMTELLLNTSLDQTQSRYAGTIARSGQALLAVINDILDFSKIEAGKLELSRSAFNLRELVEDVAEMVADNAHKKGVEIALYMAPDSHIAFNGDSARLRQVLLNLLSNAVKFTATGEVKLLVTVGEKTRDITPVSFRVIDSGIGIHPDNQKSIFESFVQADGTTTREYGGTGLGLAISQKLVGLMGGEISVSSVMGQGSTFWFEVALEPLPNKVAQAWQTPNSLVGKRILIVDDNQTNREILETQIDFWGAQPSVATCAKEALHEIEVVSGTDKVFDVVILDMHMPGMSGMELADCVSRKKLASETRFILLSSTCDNLDVQTCHSIGISSFANKPVRQPDLYNCLAAVLQSDNVAVTDDRSFVKKIETSTLQGHILLAEDNPVNQEMMIEMLRLLGLTADLACNGEEVLSALESETYKIILMDCQMPVLDGFGATQKIRELEKHGFHKGRIPIIALTANAMQGDKERCIDSGMDDYLSKPVNTQQLRETIGRWIDFTASTSAAVQESRNTDSTPGKEAMQLSAVVDDRIFDELLSMTAQAPAGFYQRLVDKFDETSQEDLHLLADAISNNDAEQVGAMAHRIKSSSVSWGAVRLGDLLAELEFAGKKSDLDRAPNLLYQIVVERDRLLQFLRIEEAKAA